MPIGGAIAQTGPQSNGTDNAQQESYRCETGDRFRLFALDYPLKDQASGCRVLYEKSDPAAPVRTLWRATRSLQFCLDRMRSSVNKLVKAGWQCDKQPVTFTKYDGQPEPDQVTNQLNKKAIVPGTPAPDTPSIALAPKQQPPEPEYNDWFHRWDSASRGIVFTLSNTRDGRKARSFLYGHRALSPAQTEPDDIVHIKSKQAGSILIVIWPANRSRYLTAIDPLRQDKPFCELKLSTLPGASWSYGIEDDAVVLSGHQQSSSQSDQLVQVRETCPMNSNSKRTLARTES